MAHQIAQQPTPRVSPEEKEQLLAEYRRLGFEHRSPAHVVYHGAHVFCPWPDCDHRIAAIGFHLEKMGAPPSVECYLEAWWQGAGLVGNCPSCGRPVLFGMTDKQVVTDLATSGFLALPDDWHQKAFLVPEPER
jgi:hypothetical protein